MLQLVRRTFGMMLVVLLAMAGPVSAIGAASPDLLGARESAGRSVCLVKAEGPLGLPVAYATGFLLGEGRFVVTDLASVAQPGVKQVTLHFADGGTAVGREFGMADPASGLTAIHVDKPDPKREGLSLTVAAPGEEGLPVATLGWKWAEELDLSLGTLRNGVPTAELAGQLDLKPPQTAATFLTLLGPRLEVASGAPLLDQTGGVVGILLRMAAVDQMIVVPAGLLRNALLSAGAQLKPLADLPKPVWPVAVQVLAGKALTPAAFAGAVRAIKGRSRCRKCGGKGKTVVKKLVGTHKVAGMVRPVYRESAETCKVCVGEGVTCDDRLYEYFARMATGATEILVTPDSPERVKEAAVTQAKSLLHALGKVGPRYRDALVAQTVTDLAAADTPFPRGVVVYAQLQASFEEAGGRYTLLAPFRSPVLLAVETKELDHPLGEDGDPAAVKPIEGDWIIIGGLAEGRVTLQGKQPLFVRPFGWSWGPSLGPRPRTPGPSRDPNRKPPTSRDDGQPDFFGL